MRRVAYLTPLYFDESSYLGGGERYPLNLARAVARTGRYAVELVSYGPPGTSRVVPIEESVTLRVLPAAAGPDDAERLSWEIVPLLRDVDLVHVHQVFCRSSEVGVLAAKLLGKPVCATDHGGATSRLGRSLGMLGLVERVVSYSRFGAGLIEAETPVDVVFGGVDDDLFHPSGAPVRDRVVFVGRLLPHKGVDRLIAALPPGVRLVVCGRPYHEEYVDVLRALAAGKSVEFLTEATDLDIRSQYQRAIAVVLPSVHIDFYGTSQAWPELMGFTLLEGMACGAPGVCSRVGGMPEYVDHGRTGFVFDSLAELTDHLSRLADDPTLVDRMGRAATREVSERFGLGPAGRAMTAIYDAILADGD